MYRQVIFYLLLPFFVFNSVAFSQNWIPLEVENRWDYFVEVQHHGGDISYDTLSVEIIDHRLLPNGLEYFEFSSGFPFYVLSPSKFLREEDNKFYYFDEEDSSDCFTLRFDLPVDTFYIDCRGYQKHIQSIDTTFTFGFPDIRQIQQGYFEFSYNFGPYYFVIPDITAYYHTLKGCIISVVTYGNLLVSVGKEEQIARDFKLSQNYPNPFNPSTTIKYKVPELSFVTIRVYDALGREVATLVDGEKLAGEYEVEFNPASGIRIPASGIYFYQLR